MGRSLSRLGCLAEGHEVRHRNLRGDSAISERGALRTHQSIAACMVSVPSNIAEGQARFSQEEFHHFLSQARGSLVEIETQLLIARDLKYLQPTKAVALLAAADELGRVLNGLIASIKSRAA